EVSVHAVRNVRADRMDEKDGIRRVAGVWGLVSGRVDSVEAADHAACRWLVAGLPGLWPGALRRFAPSGRTGGLNQILSLSARYAKTPLRGLLRIWRRGGDSNPRGAINACLISSQVHSTTLPPLRWSRHGGRGRNDTGTRRAPQDEALHCAAPDDAPARPMSEITVPVSFGELLDKISILQIKSERMSDEAKLANVRRELSALEKTWMAHPAAGNDIARLRADLKAVNERLWEIEDDV